MSIEDKLIKDSERLFKSVERSNMEAIWQEVAEFELPNSSGIFSTDGDDTPGARKTSRLYDSTAIQANQDLAASIHSTMTNPASMWSKIRFKDDSLNNNEEAVKWLEEVNKRIHQAFNESNFDTEASRNYQAYSSLGTMVLFHEEVDTESPLSFGGFRFKGLHLSEVACDEGIDGSVDTVFRKFKITLKQMFEKWPDQMDDGMLTQMEKDPSTKITILHAVFERKVTEVTIDPLTGLAPPNKRPVASIYVDMKKGVLLEEGGFYEFPYYVTRWSTMPGEVYGRSPGMIALGDVRTLNTLKKITLEGVAKAVNPPMFAQERSILGSIDLRPSKISIVSDIDGLKEFNTGARFDVSNFTAKELQEQIKSVFFLDKLLLPPRQDTGEMTATEVLQRLEQMQKVLGSTLGRLNSEFLSPLIVRSFKIMLRGGALPIEPSIVAESPLDVEIVFINSLARAQQIEDVNTIQGWIQQLAGLAQLKPEVLDYIDADGIAKHLAKVRGVPEVAIKSDDVVAELRKQQAQAAQEGEALEAGVKLADIESKLNKGGGE